MGLEARLITVKCKLRVCCLVKNAPLPRTSYHLRKGQKTLAKVGNPFYRMPVITALWVSLLRNSVALKDLSLTLRSGEGSIVHCPEVWEGWVTSPYSHHEMKPGKHDSDLLIISDAG